MTASWHTTTRSTPGTLASRYGSQVWLRSALLVALGYIALALQTWLITSMSLWTNLPL